MNKTRIVLADDHTLMRAGLRVLLEREPDLVVVGEARRRAPDHRSRGVPAA